MKYIYIIILMNFKEYLTVVKNKQKTFPFKYYERKEHYINIDSSDRDIYKYENANNYRIDLSKEGLTNVIKIELINTMFINNKLTIDNTNNLLIIEINGLSYSVELEQGLYVADDIRYEIEEKLNSIAVNVAFIVTIENLHLKINCYIKETYSVVNSTQGSNVITFDITSSSNTIPQIGSNIIIQDTTNLNGVGDQYLLGLHTVTNSTTGVSFSVDLDANASPISSQTGSAITLVPLLFSILDNNTAANLGFTSTATTESTSILAVNKLDCYNDQFFYICSPQLCGNFSTTGNVSDIFAKVNIVGDYSESYLNSYVAGTRVFEEPIDLNKVDFSFLHHDNTYVDFNGTEHNFVLKITRLLYKLDSGNNDEKELYRILYTIMNQHIKS